MGAGHAHLYVERASPLHRLRPQCKIAAALLFTLAVVATPREAVWAFGLHALLLVAVARLGQVPLGLLARRLVIELPFVLFAFFLPFVSRGPRAELPLLGLAVSTSGLWAAWNVLAKATLGVAATVLLAATTPVPQLLDGLERLKLPRAMVLIASFMVRYLDVVIEEARRMRIARASRGYDPRWLWQARPIAASFGALFIRAYERGERVWLAMVSRGWTGALPALEELAAPRAQWAAAFALPAAAAAVTMAAWWSP